MKYLCLIPAMLMAVPVSAKTQAQIDHRYTKDYHQCMDASEGVTSAMMDCSGAEIDRQDARLNQAYVMVMRSLPPAKKEALRLSERAWIKQRDAACRREVGEEAGGSMGGLIYSDCILRETVKRTLFLEHYR